MNAGPHGVGRFALLTPCQAGTAAGAFVVALVARRPWFCCRQLVAVLLPFGRRRTGLAEKGRAGPGILLDAPLRVLRHAASRRCVGLVPGRAG